MSLFNLKTFSDFTLDLKLNSLPWPTKPQAILSYFCFYPSACPSPPGVLPAKYTGRSLESSQALSLTVPSAQIFSPPSEWLNDYSTLRVKVRKVMLRRWYSNWGLNYKDAPTFKPSSGKRTLGKGNSYCKVLWGQALWSWETGRRALWLSEVRRRRTHRMNSHQIMQAFVSQGNGFGLHFLNITAAHGRL